MEEFMKDKLKNIVNEFLGELKDVTEAEKHKYVVKLEYKMGDENVYSLYDNHAKQLIKYDKLDRIKSYFNIRNIYKIIKSMNMSIH